MESVRQQIAEVAAYDGAPVLITGESGVGKELVARGIHACSSRGASEPVVINVAGVPESLLESELFGHEPGAFTGAAKRRRGYFEQADGSTLVLDEIGEMSLSGQAKLLRAVEERRFYRVGGERPVRADVRIIASSNRNLRVMASEGEFREDLYFRLSVVTIVVPPLRERTGDIPLLVEHFAREFSRQSDRRIKRFTAEAMNLLISHPWPGNVRELRNFVERASVRGGHWLIGVDHVKRLLDEGTIRPRLTERLRASEAEATRGTKLRRKERFTPLDDPRAARVRLIQALKEGASKRAAARLLGCSRGTVYNMIARFQVQEREWKADQPARDPKAHGSR